MVPVSSRTTPHVTTSPTDAPDSSGCPAPSQSARRSAVDTTVGADELARVTATNLHGEFATVTTTLEAVAALPRHT